MSILLGEDKISHLLAAGVNPKVASERAGHASVAITLDVYSHVLPGLQEDVARQVDAALRKVFRHQIAALGCESGCKGQFGRSEKDKNGNSVK